MNFIVINLKKYLITALFILFTISLLLFSSSNLIAAQNGLALWATSVLPALFPFFVATELLCRTNFIYILGKFLNKIMRPVFNVPGESAIAIILGMISGYPVGAKVVCNLKEKKIISKTEAERLIAFTNNSGPLFILGTVGIALFRDKRIGVILLISHILSALTVGYIFKYWKRKEFKVEFSNDTSSNNKLIRVSELGEIFGDSIKKSISAILTIGGFVVLFSVIISILENSGFIASLAFILSKFGISEDISFSLIIGLLEITNGVKSTSIIYSQMPTSSILLSTFIIGFSGISVLLQVFSIISKENISVKPYIYGKFLQAIFSVIYTFILL